MAALVPESTTLGSFIPGDVARSLKELSSLSPFPYPKAIAGLALIIYERSEDYGGPISDLQHLTRMVLDTVSTVAQNLHEIGNQIDEEVTCCSSQLLRALEAIADFVKEHSKKNKFPRILSANQLRKTINSFQDDLDTAINILSLCLKLKTLTLTARTQKMAENNEDELQQAINSALRTQDEYLKSHLLKEDLADGRLPTTIPAAPQIFFGRTPIVKELVDSFAGNDLLTASKEKRVAILGPGGIGKTSLALTVLHDANIVSSFGRHRYFVPCESLLNTDALVHHLGKRFGIPIPSTISLQARRSHLGSRLKSILKTLDTPLLVVLDNFETPWESVANRSEAEDLLQILTDIPQFSLLVTMRGAERPSGIAWSRPFLPPLTTLDSESARRTFVAISDVSAEDPDLPELLEVLENVPLAVTLMANLAQEQTCRELLQKWKHEKTSMLTRGWDSRTSSVDVSIQVSLSSDRLRSNPSSFSVLQILSMLPDGSVAQDLASMSENPLQVPGAITSLRRVALVQERTVSEAQASCLHVLSPIREFVKNRYPISSKAFALVARHLIALIESTEIDRSSSEDLQRLRNMRTQMTNICVVVSHGLAENLLMKELIRALIHIQSFGDDAIPGFVLTLLQTGMITAQKISDKELEAACLTCSYENMVSTELKDCRATLEKALSIYKHENLQSKNAHREHVRCLRQYGDIWKRIGDLHKALDVLKEGLELARMHGLFAEQAKLLAALAGIYSALNQTADTLKAAHSAITIAEAYSIPLARARADTILSELYFKRASYSLSARFSQRAIQTTLQLMGPCRGYAINLLWMARIHYIQSRLDLAEQTYAEARSIFARIGSTDWMSAATVWIGRVRLARGDIAGALTNFHVALQKWRDLQWIREEADSLSAIGEAELRQGNVILARSHFTKATEAFRAGQEYGSRRYAEAIVGLAEVSLSKNSTGAAMTFFVLASAIYRHANDRLSVANIVKKMGDVQFQLQQWNDARSCYLAAYEMLRFLGVKWPLADALLGLGNVDEIDDQKESAKSKWQMALKLYTDNLCKQQICVEKLANLDSRNRSPAVKKPLS
ncbi:TPR-like protein [Sistotremastrum suecicum HHB10207 ss-3]|uniref:TPR-like protein n=1 Tax=Sistotremastrum suecicum HHB10207 ss-3 TaxID=1314776 RepID=A0A166CCG5_9AGAM|nr:TPR-like protein [Sistotremastrum suecicum HHB10207 ss-3]